MTVFLDEGMLELQVLELLAGELRQHLALAESVARQAGIEQLVGQHQHFRLPVARHPDRHVFDVRPQRDRLVGRQRPGRGGPDHQRHGMRADGIEADADALRELGRIRHAEFHVHGGRGFVLVFHLGFGQR